MMLDDEPLAFLTDLCRLPESVITSSLTQYSRNQTVRYIIRAGILERTLVICGAPKGDSVYERYEFAKQLCARYKLPVQFEHCTTRSAFLDLIAEVKPQLLIIDTHGSFRSNEEGSVLQFGDEILNGNDVSAIQTTPSLVFLSCCWGAPVYGCANTIAQAFFEAGSLSVTTTFLPVNVVTGTALYMRVLRNLSDATKQNIHRDWSSFLSHLYRTSYFSDCIDRVKKALGNDCITMKDSQAAWTKFGTRSMHPPHRKGLFASAFDRVIDVVRGDLQQRAREILERRDFLPEFLFYTTLGRADLILFEPFREATFISETAEIVRYDQ
jgi:hypothetical protein